MRSAHGSRASKCTRARGMGGEGREALVEASSTALAHTPVSAEPRAMKKGAETNARKPPKLSSALQPFAVVRRARLFRQSVCTSPGAWAGLCVTAPKFVRSFEFGRGRHGSVQQIKVLLVGGWLANAGSLVLPHNAIWSRCQRPQHRAKAFVRRPGWANHRGCFAWRTVCQAPSSRRPRLCDVPPRPPPAPLRFIWAVAARASG